MEDKLKKKVDLITYDYISPYLKDKILKIAGFSAESVLSIQPNSELKNEAVAALVMLGFNAALSQKSVDQIIKKEPNLRVEQLIKLALKSM